MRPAAVYGCERCQRFDREVRELEADRDDLVKILASHEGTIRNLELRHLEREHRLAQLKSMLQATRQLIVKLEEMLP